MRREIKKILAVALTVSVSLAGMGCGKAKKEPKPTPKTAVKVDEGNANAGGKGEGQADVPLVIGTGKFSKNFNPFSVKTEADKQAVELTQVRLIDYDRAGKLVYKGIDGELRAYNGENYTYYGVSDMKISYDEQKNTTSYDIKLRDDLSFSDGEKLTMDDVIFSLYVFCDNSYQGDVALKNMPIKGLLNYQANSNKAESLSEKKLLKLMKKEKKSFRKWLIKQGKAELGKKLSGKKIAADESLYRQARIYFSKNKGKKVNYIAGIQKLGDYELRIVTDGYNRRMSAALCIPICALHYYGDTSKYDEEAHKFGFRRNDISGVLANKSTPMGAGPYRYVKYESDVLYFTSNEMYFLGCPQIAFLQLKNMEQTLEETKRTLAEKLAQEGNEESQAIQNGTDESEETKEPESTTNPSAEVTEIREGTVDVLQGSFRGEELTWISRANSNEKLSGTTIDTHLVGDGNYYYIGIHGKNVSVGEKSESDASKSLRSALAVLFTAARDMVKEQEGDGVKLVDYPEISESWISPSTEDEYENVFAKNASGERIYDDSDDVDTKMKKASERALEYLETAGYTVENGKVTAAPAGAALTYSIWVAGGIEHPFVPALIKVSETLESLGIKINLSYYSEEEMQQKMSSGKQQLWVGKRNVQDVNLAERYVKAGNMFGISDVTLQAGAQRLETYLTSEQRSMAYQQCYDKLLEWAVEVPMCEFRNGLLFSGARVKADTIAKDVSPYYGWMREIQKIEMK